MNHTLHITGMWLWNKELRFAYNVSAEFRNWQQTSTTEFDQVDKLNETLISLPLISGFFLGGEGVVEGWHFREGNSFSASARHSERPNHQTEWNVVIFEYSWSQKLQSSAGMLCRFENQLKWKYRSIKKAMTLNLSPNDA